MARSGDQASAPTGRRGGRAARIDRLEQAALAHGGVAPGAVPSQSAWTAPEAAGPPTTLIIACGALVSELMAVIELNRWNHMAVTALPAVLHNRPEQIPAAVRGKIRANRAQYDRILCLYGDCGTGGLLDAMLEAEGVERIDGAHCYAFFTGLAAFDALVAPEPGVFFLTDYLVRHFDRLIIAGLGLDRYPQLMSDYFGHYTKLVYLGQMPDPALEAKAAKAAERLGLALEIRHTGLDGLTDFLKRFPERAVRAAE